VDTHSIRNRSWLWTLPIAALILLGFCVFVLKERGAGFRWSVFAAAFLQLRPLWVLASVAFALLTYYGRAIRWRVMLKPLQPQVRARDLFTATAIGFTAVVLLGRPGEFIRPYLISAKAQVPFSSQVAAWLIERVYDLLIVLLIFGFALSRVRSAGLEVGPGLQFAFQIGGTVVGVACAACLIFLCLIGWFSGPMRHLLLKPLSFLASHHYAKAERILTAFVSGLEATRSPYALISLILLTLLEWFLIAMCYFCLFRAFPGLARFTPLDIAVFVGFVSFGSVVQLPGVGGGVQLAAALVLTELFNVPLEMASSVAIMVWIITFLVIVPIGLALALREGLNLRKLREIEREAVL